MKLTDVLRPDVHHLQLAAFLEDVMVLKAKQRISYVSLHLKLVVGLAKDAETVHTNVIVPPQPQLVHHIKRT